MPRRDVKITLDTAAQPNPECPQFAENADEFVRAACTEFHKEAKVIKASHTSGDPLGTLNFVGTHGGLIMTVLEAHNNHRHLVLHPDEFIIAILLQLADRRWILDPGSRGQAEAGFRIRTKDKIRSDNNETVMKTVISDVTEDAPEDHGYSIPKILKWVLKGSMVPSIKEADADSKGSNELFWGGSIPSVTLLGEKTDWEKLSQDFQSLGPKDRTIIPYLMALTRLSNYFAKSFDNPEDVDVILFWRNICPQQEQKGWLAVFNTTDIVMGLTYPLYLGGNGGPSLETYAGSIKENRYSSGHRKLNFLFDYGEGDHSARTR